MSSNHESLMVGPEGWFFKASKEWKVGPSTTISKKLIPMQTLVHEYGHKTLGEPHEEGIEHANIV